jgi:hypothetical protein
MKKILFVLMVSLIVNYGYTQEKEKKNDEEFKTIFSGDKKKNGKITHGGYGAVLFNYTQIDKKNAFLAGIRGMWIINHGIGIGIGGYGFANDLNYNSDGNGENEYSLAGGYGGLVIEPIVGAKKVVHVSFPVLIGAGGVASLKEKYYYDWYDEYYYENVDSEAYFVFEPGVEVEFNMVKFLRIGLGAYYRLTSDVKLRTDWDAPKYKRELDGFSFGLSLKFGKF